MPIAAISPWTFRFFAVALLFLALALGLQAGGMGFPNHAAAAPETLIIVHLVAIGWLSLAMFGALLQFLPVLLGRALVAEALIAPALLATALGVLILCLGFASLGGHLLVDRTPLLLALGALGTAGGLGLLAIVCALTLMAARSRALIARFVGLALVALLITLVMGAIFASLLAGFSAAGLLEAEALTNLLGEGRALHATLGFGGWLSVMAFGVSYRLFGMFTIAPEGARMRQVFWLALAGCLLLIAQVAWLMADGQILFLLALPLIATTALAYLAEVYSLLKNRRRKRLEINMRASLPALAALAIALPLLALGQLPDAGETLTAAALHLLAFGWLGGLTLAQMFKILSFLTWIEVFSGKMGKGKLPLVHDLCPDRGAARSLSAYYLGAGSATLGMAFSCALLAQAGAALMLGAVCYAALLFIGIRRLAFLPVAERPSPLPRLLIPHLQPEQL